LATYINSLPINKNSQNNEYKPGYLGIIFTLLTIFALYYVVIKRKIIGLYEKIFFSIALVGLILSLGPFLHLGRHTIHKPFPIPLPYLLFYYIIPGFNGIRNSARWEMLFVIAMAVTIALIISHTLKKVKLRVRVAIYFLLFAGIFFEFVPRLPYIMVPQKEYFPPVYTWMKTTPTDAVFIQMPVYTWNMQPYVFSENLREYESTVDFRPMVNGASGFSPEPWQQMVISLMYNFPSKNSITYLKDIGVNYIILHKKEYDTLNKSRMEINSKEIKNGSIIVNSLLHNKQVHFVKQFGDDYVFKIS
jgi:hypothetical protein